MRRPRKLNWLRRKHWLAAWRARYFTIPQT